MKIKLISKQKKTIYLISIFTIITIIYNSQIYNDNIYKV